MNDPPGSSAKAPEAAKLKLEKRNLSSRTQPLPRRMCPHNGEICLDHNLESISRTSRNLTNLKLISDL